MSLHERTTVHCLRHDAPPRRSGWRGAILMEVIVALGLLVVTATVMLGGMSLSARAVKRLRLDNQAADLAVTLLSEIQMGLIEIASDGPNEYFEEDLEGWTWEVAVTSVEQTLLEEAEFTQIEVIIANEPAGFKHRLVLLLPEPELDWADSLEDTFESEDAPGDESGELDSTDSDAKRRPDIRSDRPTPRRRGTPRGRRASREDN